MREDYADARKDFCNNGTKEGTEEKRKVMRAVLKRLEKEPRRNKKNIEDLKEKK